MSSIQLSMNPEPVTNELTLLCSLYSTQENAEKKCKYAYLVEVRIRNMEIGI